ncbi:MAG: hypothetical protein Q7R22_001500 [Verrucomicrobiota bacterium JB025]|nr:hypothetical protein [Verrucomicrobiota bacterium JB025]
MTKFKRHLTILAGLAALLASCAPDPLAIPAPAKSVTREQAIATAYTYTRVQWTPEPRHIRHAPDSNGVLVHTPDTSLTEHGFSNGWWKPGQAATGMPYQWGGFDTPRQFLDSLARGESAGDISTAAKRRLGDYGTSAEACGIDCSGFISRCWRLDRPHSTKQLPAICTQLDSWSELQPGDILLNDRHVLLFKAWWPDKKSILCYEAGPFPVWSVNAARITAAKLEREGYHPWRYRHITGS